MRLPDVLALPRVGWQDRDLLPPVPGLYFVVVEDRVIYIGKSGKSLRERWRQYPLRRVFEEDGAFEVAYVRMSDLEALKIAEKNAIRAMRPDHNFNYVEGALKHKLAYIQRCKNRHPSPGPGQPSGG